MGCWEYDGIGSPGYVYLDPNSAGAPQLVTYLCTLRSMEPTDGTPLQALKLRYYLMLRRIDMFLGLVEKCVS